MAYDIRETGVYLTKGYLTKDRWMSYWYQITETMDLAPKSILEIGPGNKIVTDILKKIGYEVRTLDIDPANAPDIVADIATMKKDDVGEYDMIMACQILEHIRYEDIPAALANFRAMSRKYLLISLPYTEKGTVKLFFSVMLLPFMRRKSFAKIFRLWPRPWVYNGIHYWEIGVKGYPLSRVLGDIRRAGWNVRRHFTAKENPYHYFIICEKADI